MFLIGILYLFWAIMIFFFYLASPSDVGLTLFTENIIQLDEASKNAIT